MMRTRAFLILLLALCVLPLHTVSAIEPVRPTDEDTSATEVELPERIDSDWILIYEQAYGVEGLYLDEPPAGDDLPAQCRENLAMLTKAAATWGMLHEDPPTVEALKAAERIEEAPQCPQGGTYTWNEDENRFDCTTGGSHSLVVGALRQLLGMELYEERVATAPLSVRKSWQIIYNDEKAPELLHREIETRMFALRYTDSAEIRQTMRIQSLLGELNAAIELATASELLEKDQEITMKDVGATGLIDRLEALPGQGRYRVSKVGEPPVAVYPDGDIPYSNQAIIDKMQELADGALEQYPDYPPALALRARYMDGEEALKGINKAIELWPDVPALHVQRLATNARLNRVKDFTPDLDYLLARFPAAPILLEIDSATRLGKVGLAPPIRASITTPMATVRPEILTVQLLAMKALSSANEQDQANALYKRLIKSHPGYEPLVSPDGSYRRTMPR
ncbi:hypothetical protein KQI84_04250 [bacterium]|nr:hypothetical protein [bacterium]